jgi:sigma-B regulation protein RsbU (phosphoserine phosphatase)
VQVCRQASGAQEILDHLFARLDRFVGEDRQLEDDASMVVLKVREQLRPPQLPPPKRVSS